MKYTFICSPYGGSEENIKLAKRFMRYAAWCGLTPIAPHVMFHNVLNDFNPAQRDQGMAAGRDMLKMCKTLWQCGDTISPGMKQEIQIAKDYFFRIRQVPISELEKWEFDMQYNARQFEMQLEDK